MEAVVASVAGFTSAQIRVQTQRPREFVDITDEVEQIIADSGIRDGLVVVTSMHTTAAIAVNEHEPELFKDLDRFLNELAPSNGSYAHNSAPCGPGEHPNGHAHCQALLLSASTTIPVVDRCPVLGRYQRVFLIELDHARPRRVTVAVLGS